jgi:hemoglobin
MMKWIAERSPASTRLADVGLANDGALRQVLHDYFAWATTTTMSRYHQSADDVPNGLSIPHWSWDGSHLH